jgi:hypothetical protein
MATENTRAALSELDRLIRDPRTRYQFHDDPDTTFRNTGADPDDVPAGVWQALTEMGPAELDAVATLGDALAEAGLLDGNELWTIII